MNTVDTPPRGWDEGPGLLQSAWRYKWLIAVVALLGAAIAYGWAARQPTLYEGVSEVLLSGAGTAGGSGDEPPGPIGDPERYLQNQATLITKTPVLRLAVRNSGDRVSVTDLGQRLSVEVDQDADVITISVLDGDAEQAAVLANAVADAYKDYVEGQPGERASQLRSRRTEMETRLDQIRAELAAAPDDDSLLRRRDAIVQELNKIEVALAGAEADVGGSLVEVERAVPPEQPVQPATRRTMAVGLLFGLVASVALAWWLNSRWSMPAEPVWAWSGPPAALSPSPSGGTASGGQARAMAPESAGPVSGATDATPWRNGTRSGGPIPRLIRRLKEGLDLAGRQAPQAAVVKNGEPTSLTSLLIRLDRTLASQPLEFYSEALPQAIAEELPADVSADMVVVMLDDEEGSFRVEGAVGLAADERNVAVEHDHRAFRQALLDGVSVFDDADGLRTSAAGIPGTRTADALMLLPLVQGRSWLGMLVIGRRTHNGHRATPFSDEEVTRALVTGTEAAYCLQSLMLATRLQECLKTIEPSNEDRHAAQ
jgi:capsular polysaccharide biosynthesis protein